MKENENTRGREGSGVAESNTPAPTSDPIQSSNSKESRSSDHQSKREDLTDNLSQELYNSHKILCVCVCVYACMCVCVCVCVCVLGGGI